ncbi:POK19 protein, partial [Atrichornis clamosus]|nr:POK19 protein [Atrichornis clamosus]
IKHSTGIPHVSTGQAMVERANRTIKEYLTKQKNDEETDPSVRLAKVIFTLNFLSITGDAENPPVVTHYSQI